ncbi:aldolase [Cystobasidium minutum MCA 4210]|uniref:aldolase n=1 Tax=Cystobasidium minutum MCA 4210 TaxID=1397322 RepID=UPI0034CD9578|eukprot:jgi/Rhomi1/94060/CE94059_2406
MSLLEELRKHSCIDIDCNDDAVASKFAPFQDMTSNQLIVLGQVRQSSHAAIIPEACDLARSRQAHYESVPLPDLAVDYMTALLGKRVAEHLHPEGYLHAQTLPSLAHDASATVEHARRLVKVYADLGIPQNRICIKIPSTVAGLKACSTLESQYDIRTLATTCFTLAQGLAAAEAGCRYVAPYVNPLIVHIDPSQHKLSKDPLKELTGTQVTFAIQKAYRELIRKTQVLAASLVTAEEMFALCGIDHITLSAAGLALLAATPLDDHFKGIRDRSLQYLADTAAKPDEGVAFFNPSLDAMADTKVEALQVDALTHFGAAEVALRALAKQQLSGA